MNKQDDISLEWRNSLNVSDNYLELILETIISKNS
jgi:hypothetical protein